MSTAAPTRARRVASAGSVAPAPELLHPLARIRGTIHTYVLLDAALFALLFVTCWFWIGVAADWGLFALTGVDVAQDMPAIFRLLTTVFLGVLLVTLLFLRGYSLLRQELSDTNLALLLEKRYPKLLGDRLITAIELADVDRAASQGYSRDMVLKTIADARERVGQVRVSRVFNWFRLWVKLFLILGVSLVGLGAGLAVYLTNREPTVAGSYAAKMTDVAHIWTERHVTFAGTPWPRRAHVELIDFPESGELRVGKTAAGPTVRARAYKWVVAAPGTRDGWRPLLWSDLNTTSIRGKVITCPVPSMTDITRTFTSYRPSGMSPETPREQYTDAALANITVDEVEFALGLNVDAEVDEALASGTETAASILDRTEAMGPTTANLRDAFRRLNVLARDASYSRTFRKLLTPRPVTVIDDNGEEKTEDQTLTLVYIGKKTGAPVTLTRQPTGESAGQVAGLKESVFFDISFENYTTDLKQIVLVPPPAFTDIQSTDYHPAYLYHKPPGGDLSSLRGLKQVFAGNKLTLTGDVTDHQVPFGSEIELTASTDKPLKSARLIPKTPNLRKQEATADQPAKPGDLAVKTATRKVDVDGREVEEEYSLVTVSFRKLTRQFELSGQTVSEVLLDEAINQPTEFELEITDRDGVQSSRLIKFRTTEDGQPDVKLAVDDLFKVGPEYWFTPQARIPFATGSGVTDSVGLSKVVFDFKWNTVESAAVAAAIAELAAPSASAAPPASIAPTPAAAAAAAAVTAAALSIDAGTVQVQAGTFPVPRFVRDYEALQVETLDGLKKKLGEKFDGTFGVVRGVKLVEQTVDVFDVEAALPTLAAKEGEAQPRYLVKLNVVATDTNADRVAPLSDWATRRFAGNSTLPPRRYEVPAPPKTATETTSVPVMIVSPAELLAELSKKEDALLTKIDEAVKRVEDAQRKLNEQAGYLVNPDIEALKNAAVRSGDILLDVSKARNIAQELLVQYVNLATVIKVNRLREDVLKTFENPPPAGSTLPRGDGYVDLLAFMLRADPNPGPFQLTGNALDAFQAPLAAVPPVRPTDAQVTAARNEIGVLLKELRELQSKAGGRTTINEAIRKAQELIRLQDIIKTNLASVIEENRKSRETPRLTAPEQLTLKAGEKKTVKVKIDWQLYRDSEVLINVEMLPKDSDVVVPKDITVKEEKSPTDFEFEVTAGQKPGLTVIKLTPDKGRSAELRIEVVK